MPDLKPRDRIIRPIAPEVRARLAALEAGEKPSEPDRISCCVEDCPKPRKRGSRMCSMHTARRARTGTTDPGRLAHASIEARYWRQVIQHPGGCWEWPGAKNDAGYGQVRRREGGVAYVHRLSYEIHNGPIPDGVEVMHRCDNPPCSNPDHLQLGTHADNMSDAQRKGKFIGVHQRSGPDRITPEKVAAIRRLRGEGIPRATVAEMFRTSPTNITNITSGRTWRQAGARDNCGFEWEGDVIGEDREDRFETARAYLAADLDWRITDDMDLCPKCGAT